MHKDRKYKGVSAENAYPVSKAPAQHETARERVYKTIQQWIVDATFLPEERLNDVELSKYFSISGTYVRGAPQMPANQGIVIMVPSSGTYVAPVDYKDLVYVYELIGELQSYAIEAGISSVSRQTLAALHMVNEIFHSYAATGDAANSIAADREFHHIIASLPGSPYPVSFTEELMIKAHRSEYRFFMECIHPHQSHDAHRRIIEALREGNVTAAGEAIKLNWRISILRQDT